MMTADDEEITREKCLTCDMKKRRRMDCLELGGGGGGALKRRGGRDSLGRLISRLCTLL